LELKSTEDDFVVYKASADNREMGQAFGKKFDKAAKAAIENLSSDMIRQYLKTENIEVNGLNITAGMLKVSKDFKEEYQKSTKWAVASSMLSSVMLDTE
jgi:predicted class III extradiol MEMO1 family dioxygenase